MRISLAVWEAPITKGIGDEFGANVRVAREQGFEMKGQDIGKIRCINTPISEILIAGVCVGSDAPRGRFAIWRFPVLHDGSVGQPGG